MITPTQISPLLREAKGIPISHLSRWLNIPPAPRAISYAVTWRCNAKCLMCGTPHRKIDSADTLRELSPSDIESIFSDRYLRKLNLIRFTGGEPFLKDDFPQMVEMINRCCQVDIFYITTNGSLTLKIVELIKTLPPEVNLHLQVSLDALGPLHDRIRRLPGLYQQVEETIRELKYWQGRRSLQVGINQTIIRENIGELEAVNRWAMDRGINHHIYLAYRDHESRQYPDNPPSPRPLRLFSDLPQEKLKYLYHQIRKIKGRAKFHLPLKSNSPNGFLWKLVEGYLQAGSKNRILTRSNTPKPPCLALFRYFRLDPYGNISPCTLKPRPLGNLRNKTFTELWYSNEAKGIRLEVKSCPGCWVECDIIPSIIYSGDLIWWKPRETINGFVKRFFNK